MRRLLPDVPLVVATGRGEMAETLPVGEAIDRAVALLRDRGARRVRGTPALIHLDQVTAALLGVRFEVHDDGGALVLKGQDESSFWVERKLLGKRTICFGREREIGSLGALLDECVAEPVARVVLVTGPPGIGKSRVCQEFVRRVEGRGQPIAIWRGRGDAMSAGSPFGILGGALRHALGIEAAEPAPPRRAAITARISRRIAGQDLARVAAFLGELTGTPFPDDDHPQLRAARRDPILLGDQMLRAFQDFVTAETSDRPLLIILEDLHWGDQATVRFVGSVLRLLDGRPLMVLAVARPEITDVFPRLWQDRGVQEIRLSGITRRAAESLVRHAMGDDVDAGAVAGIVARAEGHPFFLEELIRAIAAGRGDDLPETLVASVQIRLEALDEEPRRILRAASIFGETFCAGGVHALVGGEGAAVDAWLAMLEDRELISRVAQEQQRTETSYAFRHNLVRDTAYRMLTEADRRLGHRLAAGWLVGAGEQDRLVLAEHFEWGGDLAAAAIWYERAAAQALEANDLEAVIARAANGLTCGAGGEAAGRLHVLAATAHNWLGRFKEGHREASSGLALLPRWSAAWFEAAERLVWASGVLADVDRLEALAEEIREGSTAGTADREAVHAICSLVIWLYRFARDRVAEDLALIIHQLDPSSSDPAITACVYEMRSLIASHLLDPETVLQLNEAAVQEYERAGNTRNACLARINSAELLVELGDYTRAEAMLRESQIEVDRFGITYAANAVKKVLARSLAERGALEEGRAAAEDLAETSKQQGDLETEMASRLLLARVLLDGGALEQALEQAQGAVPITKASLPEHAVAGGIIAQVFLRSGRAGEALAAATGAMQILQALRSVAPCDAFVRLTFAEARFAAGDPDAARAALAAARDRLLSRADKIRAPDLRRSFLEAIPDHARTLSLADAWGLAGREK